MNIVKIDRTNQNQQNINFGWRLKRVNPDRLIDRDIYRRDKFGLAVESIDFFKGSNKVERHHKHYPAKNGNPGRAITIDFSLTGAKKIISQFFDKNLDEGVIPVKTKIRNYQNKQLTSKIKEYKGKDKNGEFEGKITTLYEPGSTIPSESLNIKRYTHAANGRKSSNNTVKITTYFDERGPIFQKTEGPKGWSTHGFDEQGHPTNPESGRPYKKKTHI